MNAGRIKDPFCKDSYLGISHLPSSRLSKPPEVGFPGSSEVCTAQWSELSKPAESSAKMKCPVLSWRLQGSKPRAFRALGLGFRGLVFFWGGFRV